MLTIGKLKQQLYEEFLYNKVIDRLDELGMNLTDEEIQKTYENEKSNPNGEIINEFNDYYQSYENGLQSKYNVKYIENVD